MPRVPHVQFVRARAGTAPKAVEGSRRALCAKCRRHRVWVTPEMERLGMRAVCAGCAPRMGK